VSSTIYKKTCLVDTGNRLAAPPFREAYLLVDQSPLFNYDLVVRTTISPNQSPEI
jgi:hypothetical protein